jgi:hypothetical protein
MMEGAFVSVMPTKVAIHDFLTVRTVKSWLPTFVRMTRLFLGVA